MDMPDKKVKKKNILSKINYAGLGIMLISIMISAFWPVPKIVVDFIMVLCSSAIYIGSLLLYKMEKGHFHIALICLCGISIIFLLLQIFFPSNQLAIIGVLWIYLYLILHNRLMHGKFDFKLIIFFSVAFIGKFVKQFFSGAGASVIIALSQILFLLRLLNPSLSKIAEDHKRNRLAIIGEETQEVSLLRKILFGKNGKLELDFLNKR